MKMAGLRDRAERERVTDDEGPRLLRDEIYELLVPWEGELVFAPEPPTTIMMLGVNGVGKTTTIAKLAYYLKARGMSVLLAAGDTFRAAAIEQLELWGQRVGVPVVAQKMGADPGAVMYDALDAAKARGLDVVIADTAGRLHTKVNLMEELRRWGGSSSAPPAVPPTNACWSSTPTPARTRSSRREFEAIGVTGIAVTKLDSTAKGGALLALTTELQIPIKLVGLGEKPEDLAPFSAREFADGIV